jgi:hypothetical protein
MGTVVRVPGTGRDFRRRIRTAAGIGSQRGERERPSGNAVVLLPGGLHPSTDPEENTMFEDQKVELLPARTTMYVAWSYNQNFNTATAVAVNADNINVDGDQHNMAFAAAAAGSNVWH